MSNLEGLKKIAKPLYAFVYKYFDKLTPEDFSHLKYEFVLSPLEVYERTLQVYQEVNQLFKSTHEEKEVMALWAHQELVLQCLVVLSNLSVMYEPLQQAGKLNEAVQLRDSIIDRLTEKSIEDPVVIHAIQTGTLEEEIEKRREARELYNFKPLFEQEESFVVDVDGVEFQEIPENF